jgi:hypothetical protein
MYFISLSLEVSTKCNGCDVIKKLSDFLGYMSHASVILEIFVAFSITKMISFSYQAFEWYMSHSCGILKNHIKIFNLKYCIISMKYLCEHMKIFTFRYKYLCERTFGHFFCKFGQRWNFFIHLRNSCPKNLYPCITSFAKKKLLFAGASTSSMAVLELQSTPLI